MARRGGQALLPLYPCAGTTVFSPLYGVKPTGRAGMVGIDGLGHLGLKFANAWGCEVFTSNESKAEEAMGFGAHCVVSSRDRDQILKAATRSISCSSR